MGPHAIALQLQNGDFHPERFDGVSEVFALRSCVDSLSAVLARSNFRKFEVKWLGYEVIGYFPRGFSSSFFGDKIISQLTVNLSDFVGQLLSQMGAGEGPGGVEPLVALKRKAMEGAERARKELTRVPWFMFEAVASLGLN